MIGSILLVVIVLSVLVLGHELGHFWMAKKMGVWVEEFGAGLPPRAIGKKIGETLYSLNWLPFGGFVRLHGEDTESEVTKPKRAFGNKSKRARALIVTAGVAMNVLIAIACFSIVYSFTGVPRDSGEVSVVEVLPDTPASGAGITEGDIVRSINGEEVISTKEFIAATGDSEGAVLLIIDRNGEMITLEAVPEEKEDGTKTIGVVISSAETYFPPIWQRPFYGVYYGFQEAYFWAKMVVAGFVAIFVSLIAGEAPQGVAGPVGIYAITSQAASYGILTLINFVGIFSINLAILNILPFPALDGGRLAFIIAEAIFGKKVLPRVENYLHMAGMVVLILLLLVITVGDVTRLYNNSWDIQAFLESFAP